jgi:hypothetical protein
MSPVEVYREPSRMVEQLQLSTSTVLYRTVEDKSKENHPLFFGESQPKLDLAPNPLIVKITGCLTLVRWVPSD